MTESKSICTHPPHLSPSAWRACLSLSSPKEANSLMEKKTQQIVCRKARWSYSGMWVYILGSLSSDVFERRTSTGNGLFALLSRDFEQIFGQIVSTRIKTLGNINTVASRLIKRGKGSLPVDVGRSKTSLLKLPISRGCALAIIIFTQISAILE